MTAPAAIYILSEGYIREARVSANSLHYHMPSMARFLFTPDPDVQAGMEFDAVIPLPPRDSALWYLDCTRYLGCALDWLNANGFEKVLYLDSDTFVLYQFWELFDILDRFDLAAVHAPKRVTCKTVRPIPLSFPELNIGVMALWNKAPLRRFVQSWYRQYTTYQGVYGNNDQGSLRESLWNYVMDVNLIDTFSFYVLPPEYNCRIVGGGIFLNGPARILHTRTDNLKKIIDTINADMGPRLWSDFEWHPLD